MGIASDRTDSVEGVMAARRLAGEAAGTLASTLLKEPILPREVVRCRQCQLVQFRTHSDLCRRCSKPLPSLLKFVEPEEMAPEGSEVTEDVPMDLSLDRASRNRQVSIGGKMKELREDRLLTQVEMAALLEIPRSYLSRIENNRLLPGPLMVAKFAASLGVGIGDLLGHERRRDGARLFPGDPLAATLYSQFARLQPKHMEMILGEVRRMISGSFNPLPAMDRPPAPQPLPEAQSLRKGPARLMQSMTRSMMQSMTAPEPRPQGTGRLAIVPVPRRFAKR
jgi:transcriptional regulator with XRE-family HTH domain